jgi:hypothetical protein
MRRTLFGAVLIALSGPSLAAQGYCGRITSLPDAWQIHTSEKTIWLVGNSEGPPDPKDIYGFLNTHLDCEKICCCILGSVKEERQPRRTLTLFTEVTGLKTCSGKVLR